MTATEPADSELPDRFDLSHNVNFLLRLAHARGDLLFNEAMGDLDLTPRQAALLHAVDRCEGGNISVLTVVTGMDRGTLSEMTPRLVKRGLLNRRPAPGDRRAKSLYLTPDGVALLRLARQRTASLRERVLASMPVEYRDLFVKMLAQMVGLETETRVVHDLLSVTRRRT
ncbi:MarR family winged helix-turn-helix transcriptional regulator [Streptomyces sp. NPDC058424]|uniref:MarR family winged helix-turn-helix transcriptional regulator n=1 Tax=Streptomyces sp. NPDC058424 TaxID=3346491 RepID=UPI00365F8817